MPEGRRALTLLAALTTLALTTLALAAAAVMASGAQLLLGGGTTKPPAWSHWWCSVSALHAGSSGGAHGNGLVAFAAGLLPHWPHLLALVIAPLTLVYLHRANARYQAERPTGRTERASRTAPSVPSPARQTRYS
jgi:hypothetical protein